MDRPRRRAEESGPGPAVEPGPGPTGSAGPATTGSAGPVTAGSAGSVPAGSPRSAGVGHAGAGRVVLLAALLLAVALAPALATAAAPASAAPGTGGSTDGEDYRPAISAASSGPPAALAQPVDADQVFMRVTLSPDGDGQWAIEYRLLLSGENETAAFEELQRDVRENTSTYLDRFDDGVGATVRSAENATGREMTVENLSVSTSTQQFGRYGVVTYRFEWRQFAAVEGEQLRAGDALAGLFIDASTALRIEWPAGYTASVVRPSPTDSGETYVVWAGERSFGSGEPRVVVSTAAGGVLGGLSPIVLGGAGLLLVLVLFGGVVWYRRQRTAGAGDGVSPTGERTAGAAATGEPTATGEGPGTTAETRTGGPDATDGPDVGQAAGTSGADPGGSADGEVASAADAGAAARTDSEATAATSADDGAASDAAGGEAAGADQPGGDGAGGDAGGDGAATVPDELLSNEERVMRLLEGHGGRIKQQQVVEELDWTAAKTSQVVTGMREEDRIEVFRLGRENVLRLPEEGPLEGAEDESDDVSDAADAESEEGGDGDDSPPENGRKST